MPKAKKKPIAAKKKIRKDYVVVSNSSYGKARKGQRVFFEGKKPSRLRDDGSITFGKIILKTLGKKFGPKFRWIISQEGDSIEVKYGIIRIRTSQRMLDRMFAENLDRSREIKKEIVERRFFAAFPSDFTMPPPSAYVPGSIV